MQLNARFIPRVVEAYDTTNDQETQEQTENHEACDQLRKKHLLDNDNLVVFHLEVNWIGLRELEISLQWVGYFEKYWKKHFVLKIHSYIW